ncbi:PAS domain S-box protein [Leptolyngbya sp. FACHB-16]|uniref:PAS domain S-box protein n=1 Tax=unclassified Leptolyngbya TaxID=2650499 RepID=UPI0016889008|nr:PAS domain S-box protein [Leptolyngbya sp. FACHB-16]MBD2155957.1 PAS domain S-box protein [Leptolyngbya sp. FACHB-16]
MQRPEPQTPQNSLDLLAVLADYSSAAIAILDPDLRYLVATRHWCQLHGLGDRSVIGESHFELFPGLDEQWQWVQGQCLNGHTEIWEEAVPTRGSDLQWLQWEARPWHNQAKEWGGVVLQVQVITHQKQMDKERDRFFNLSPDMLCIIGMDGYYKHLNPSWERVLGHTTSTLLAQPLLEFIHPNDRAATQAALQSLNQGDRVLAFETRYRCRNGAYRWLSWIANPCLETGLVYATARDISDLKESEAELRQIQRFLESVLNHLPVAVVAKEANELRFALWNPAAEKILGWEAADTLGRTDYDLFPQDQADGFVACDRQVLENRQAVVIPEEEIQIGSGETHVFSTHKTVILDATNQPQYLLAITEDITARKQAEIQLKVQQEFLQSIFDGVEYQIFVTDVTENGEFLSAGWNRVAERLTGRSAESVAGMSMEEVFGEVDGAAIRKRLESCLTQGTAITYEECLTLQGQETWWLTTVNPLRDSHGRIYRLVGTTFEMTARKQAEQALLEHQQFIQRIADSNPGILYIYDLVEQRTLYTNRDLASILGFSAERLIAGNNLSELIHPEDEPRFLQHQQELHSLVDGEIRELDYRMVNAAGTWVWFHSRETVFKRDTEGQVVQVVGTAQDITDRKTAEAALIQSQQRLSLLIQQTPLAVIEWTINGEVCAWNRAAEQIFGYTAEEAIGQHFSFLISTDLEERVTQIFQALLTQTGGTRSVDANRTQCGQEIICEWYNTPLIAANGETIGMASLAMDVTEREAAEAALAEREERLRNINTSVPGVIYQFQVDLTSGEDRFTYLSPRTVELFEMEPQIMLDQPSLIWSMIHPSELHRIQRGLAIAVQRRLPWFDEFRIITPSGQVKWVRSQAEVGAAPEGISVHNGVIIDISDRKAAEAALQESEAELRQTLAELQRTQTRMIQSEKMSSLGQLVAGVAHEINNPVNFIYGNLTHAHEYISNLLRLINLYQVQYPEPGSIITTEIKAMDLTFMTEDLPKLLNSMKVGADRIRGIVASLRTFSRMDEAAMKDIDIHEGIDSTLVILQSRLKANEDRSTIEVVKIYGVLPQVECYAGQLNQVLMNILSNAIDALDEKCRHSPKSFEPTITIQTDISRSNKARISIADNGLGMSERVRQRIFDPFFTTKPVGKGTGMGLSISYQIITENHGGSLECISDLGKGTMFLVQIPLRQR